MLQNQFFRILVLDQTHHGLQSRSNPQRHKHACCVLVELKYSPQELDELVAVHIACTQGAFFSSPQLCMRYW